MISLNSTTRQRILDNLHGVFFRRLNDSAWTLIYISQNTEKLTAYQPEELLNNKAIPFRSLIHPDDQNELSRKWEYNLEQHLPSLFEYRIICKNGNLKWVKEIASPIYGNDGTLEFIEGYIQDITSEKENSLLAESLSSYQNAINTGSIVSITDKNGIINFANELFCTFSKFSREELIGKDHRIINSGYHDKLFFKQLWDTIKAGKIWRGEIKNRDKEGKFYWVDTVITPIFNAQNEIVQFLSIRNIITDKKEAEESLKLKLKETSFSTKINEAIISDESLNEISNILLSAVYEITPAIICRMYLYDNEQNRLTVLAEKIDEPIKQQINEKTGGNILQFIPSLEEESFITDALFNKKNIITSDTIKIKEILQDVPAQSKIEKFAKTLAGQIKIKTIGILPVIFNDVLLGLITFYSSREFSVEEKQIVTRFAQQAATFISKKKSELALLKSEAFNRGILSSLTSEIAVVDHRGIVIASNDAWENFAIKKNSKIIRRTSIGQNYFESCKNKGATIDNCTEDVLAGLIAVLNGETPVFSVEYSIKLADKTLWYNLSISSYEGDNLKAVLRNDNITELKNKELELQKTAAELSDKFNELMQFNYIVSHNLRAPIANIIGLTSILTMPGINEAEKPNIVHHIQSSTLKMDELINELNMILATRSNLNTKKSIVSLPQLVHSITDTLEKQISDSGTIVTTDIPENANEIFTVKSYLESTLYNLINNAIKYKSPEHIPEVVIVTRKVNDNIIIKISDNGLGIDLLRYGSDVFGLYKRFHLEVEGKGLGLYMAKTQIESLGGKISIESAPSKGTIFTITLPAN